MTSAGQHSLDQIIASMRPTSKLDNSATRMDIALFVSAIFLQRFTLPFGNTFLHLDLVAIGFILLYQFISGKLLIQYDRFLWFLALGLAATCSLLLNFSSTMLTAYSLFLVFYSLFTLNRPSTPDQYKRTLQAFQFIVMLLSCLGVVQFVAQFVVDGRELIHFYRIVPDFLTSDPSTGWGDPRSFGRIIKSTGLFLTEPSALSQMTALGILIEVLEFRRPRYLWVLALGFLVAYSGTGLLLLLIFLPLAGLRHARAGLSALLVVVFILGLISTGIIDLWAFTSRVDEFNKQGSSGYGRFVVPILAAAKAFDMVSLQALLVGTGPGMAKSGGSVAAWFKLFYEYGIIGSFIFCCFSASCLRKSRCPGLVVAALIFAFLFLQIFMTITIGLCTLSGPESRRRHIPGSRQYEPSLAAGSAGA